MLKFKRHGHFGELNSSPVLLVVLLIQLFGIIECGDKTGRIFLNDHQKEILCALNTSTLPTCFCKNINADKYNIKPDYTDLMEKTCGAIAKALGFNQGTCMQSKNKFFFWTTSITEGCAITNSTADITTLDLNKGNQWIFLMFGDGTGDETQVTCPNGLKDFDATL
uniref:Uncharacterized protein n=1 Tax=Cacopsylla melanoneura TaxID=428564 RepID=A0A8D8M6K8_9HEMI